MLAGCSGETSAPKPKTKRYLDVQGEFRSRVYQISEHEHAVIFDVPNRLMPTRCVVFVNEKTNTSNMRCDDDSATQTLPSQGPELER